MNPEFFSGFLSDEKIAIRTQKLTFFFFFLTNYFLKTVSQKFIPRKFQMEINFQKFSVEINFQKIFVRNLFPGNIS